MRPLWMSVFTRAKGPAQWFSKAKLPHLLKGSKPFLQHLSPCPPKASDRNQVVPSLTLQNMKAQTISKAGQTTENGASAFRSIFFLGVAPGSILMLFVCFSVMGRPQHRPNSTPHPLKTSAPDFVAHHAAELGTALQGFLPTPLGWDGTGGCVHTRAQVQGGGRVE